MTHMAPMAAVHASWPPAHECIWSSGTASLAAMGLLLIGLQDTKLHGNKARNNIHDEASKHYGRCQLQVKTHRQQNCACKCMSTSQIQHNRVLNVANSHEAPTTHHATLVCKAATDQ